MGRPVSQVFILPCEGHTAVALTCLSRATALEISAAVVRIRTKVAWAESLRHMRTPLKVQILLGEHNLYLTPVEFYLFKVYVGLL